MKRLFFTLLLCIGCVAPLIASAEEVIQRLSVSATLDANRHLIIQESILYDFGDTPRHGIFRNIPVRYVRHGATYRLRLKNIDVRVDGQVVPFTQRSVGSNLEIKIGDPDKTITGAHLYTIRYETDRAVNFFPDHSELYWNVVGTDWNVSIERTDFLLDVSTLRGSSNQTICYTGPYGSQETDCFIKQEGSTIAAETQRILLPHDAFTIAVSFPLGAIQAPTWTEKVRMLLGDNMILATPFFVLFIMFLLWRWRGRDPKLATIIPEYEPPAGLSPAEVGYVAGDGSLLPHAVTATIIDLARRGFLHIRYTEEKKFFKTIQVFTFVKRDGDETTLTELERILWEGLFRKGPEVEVRQLRGQRFYLVIEKAKKALEEKMAREMVFDAHPGVVRAKYIGGMVVVILLLMHFFQNEPLGILTAIVSGIPIFIFAWIMPRRTAKGTHMLADIKGFEWFLRVTEQERLKFHNAPKKTPEQFEKFLPYAIVLRVEEEWAKQFEGMDMEPPSWTDGYAAYHLSSTSFASQMHSMNEAASSGYSAPSSSGSGGSGFSGGGSGGGGGGGGGGSW